MTSPRPSRFRFDLRTLTALAALIALPMIGCTHAPNMARAPEHCTDTTEVYMSSSAYASGATKRTVVERLTHVGRCSDVEVETSDFAKDGELDRRVFVHKRCGVVEKRVVDVYGQSEPYRETHEDLNHDGTFDVHAIEELPAVAPTVTQHLARSH